MAVISLLLAILLVNRVNPLTRVTRLSSESEVNALPEGRSTVFALQIQQIRPTSEATPAASIGNNLNVIDGSKPNKPDAQRGNFQAISKIYTFNNSKDKKYEGGEENVDPIPLADENIGGNKINFKHREENKREAKAIPLVWDNCLETMFRESQVNVLRNQDMENVHSDLSLQSKKINGSFWNKRNVGAKNAESIKVWLEKYNDLKNSKTEERRQQKPDIFVKKGSESETSTVTTETFTTSTQSSFTVPTTISSTPSPSITETTSTQTTIQIIPITREVFKEPVAPNTTQSHIIENDIVTSYTEDWFDPKDRTKIRFNGLPQRETYLIPTLELEDGFHPFSFMSQFFYLIYPFDFPVGLVKDIVWGEFTFPYSFLQADELAARLMVSGYRCSWTSVVSGDQHNKVAAYLEESTLLKPRLKTL